MSGRAGRRGIDERGIVMFMVDEKMDASVGRELLKVSLSLSSSLLSFNELLHQAMIVGFFASFSNESCLSLSMIDFF